MTSFYFPLVTPPPATPEASAVFNPGKFTVADAFLGNGLLRPFRRDQKSDFANGSGKVLVEACIGQVIGTRGSSPDGKKQGEVPWRPEFGSLIETLRHAPNDDISKQIARQYVTDALAAWEPRARLRNVTVVTDKSDKTLGGGDDTMLIRIEYDLITANIAGNQVVLLAQVLEIKV